jgi:ABC-2 type transport system ATP-binding protein
VLELHDVHKRFGPIHAVRGISLRIEAGTVAGILGPNGAGKSTTIRMILGALPPTSGAITVGGLDSLDHSRRVRSMLGYLPEANPLYPEMPVRDYLRHRTRIFAMPRAAASTAIDRAIDLCRLTTVRSQRIGTLSKGFRQRVGLAAAIVHHPKLVILDEPASGLDPAQIAEMRALIRDLAAHATILIVSHVLPEVERTCDRIVVLAHGSILADGSPADLLRSAAAACIVEAKPPAPGAAPPTIPGAPIAASHQLPDGWTSFDIAAPASTDPRETIARAFADARWTVRELRPRTPTLEALYLSLISGASPTPQERPAA